MATIYISAIGSWKGAGTSASTALDIGSLDKAIKMAGPGGTVAILADQGTYTLSAPLGIYSGGSAGAAVTIRGVSSTGAEMDAQFASNRSTVADGTGAKGSEVFKLMNNAASNLVFENMGFTNVASAVRATADVSNITVQHMTGTNVGMFFEDYAGGANKTATISGLVLDDIVVNGFSKGVVRLQYDTHDVKMTNLVGDSQYQDDPDSISAGIHLEGTVHRVTVTDTVMKNAVSADKYYNGDGYSTERGVYDVHFVRAVASGNADGGFDLKSTATTLTDTIADGNGRNYRFWGQIDMVGGIGLDPRHQGGVGGQEQVQLAKGAVVSITGGMLADRGSITQVLLNEGGILTVTDTVIVYAEGARLTPGKGMTLLDPGLVTAVPTTGRSSSDSTMLVQTLFATEPGPVVPIVEPAPIVVVPPVVVVEAPVVVHEPAPQPEPHVVVKPVVLPPVVVPAVVEPVLNIVISTAAAQTVAATADQDVFVFRTGAIGKDVITGFGKTDVLALGSALSDSNRDGLITFGKDAKIDISKKDTITLEDLKVEGVRALGQGADGLFYYGDARVRPNKASESSFGNNAMSGDAKDKKANTFFFDTALNMGQGTDTIAKFGAKDIIVSTTKMANVDAGGQWTGAAGSFGLADRSGDADGLGTVSVTNVAGAAVTSLEFDGSTTVQGVTYYVYSHVGSAAGLADLSV
jgi:hypothetical protein